VATESLDLKEYIRIAHGVYWVGYADNEYGLHCNPYLVTEGDEAVLIDGGSRNDFSTVMLKILRTGTKPDHIRRLIYQHYDPDLCGSIPHFESLIRNPGLEIISHSQNNHFIHYYSVRSRLTCIERIGMQYTFASGRQLRFYRTPYAHSPGSFITYDTQSKVLFSSDIFGSYDSGWSLYTRVTGECEDCEPQQICKRSGLKCPMTGIVDFHQNIMNSVESLHYALDTIERLDVSLIAPQHGSLIHTEEARRAIIRRLRSLQRVGFSFFIGGK